MASNKQETTDVKDKDDANSLDYGKAGAIAEEALSAIRVVTSFGAQDQILKWYCICIS